ncbi:MAG: PEP-CTERM sorting domain-containing protein [Fuerstiella sp.]
MVPLLRNRSTDWTGFTRSAACLFAVLTMLHPLAAGLITGSQNVSGNRSTPAYTHNGTTYGPFGWNYSYTRSFDGTVVKKHLEINFMFDDALNYTDAQKAAYRAAAEANIEGIWNNKFNVKDNNTNKTYAAVVDVTTTGPYNQTVEVKATKALADPPYNMTNWYVDQDTAAFQAHEFGHMLGLFDEYIGGAVNQYPNPLLSNDGLMGLGALNASPKMYARYYQQFADYVKELNPSGSFSMVPVPEPSSVILLALGFGGLVVLRRRRAADNVTVA